MTSRETVEERKKIYILKPLKTLFSRFLSMEPTFSFCNGPANHRAGHAQGLISASSMVQKEAALSVHSRE